MTTRTGATEAEREPVRRTRLKDREVRLALVLYGGVSLAIYMNGVAEEMLRLVAASRVEGPVDDSADDESAPRGETERIYRRIADDRKIRFTIDLISGSSAGGINGIALAQALVHGKSVKEFREIRQVWLDSADFSCLLDDAEGAKSREAKDTYEEARAPRSLLSGAYMTKLLTAALGALGTSRDAAGGRDPSLVDELDLHVTATDLEGLSVPVKLTDQTLSERVHRHHFSFRYRRGDGLNELSSENAAFLASVARCTAAFPGAFEPMTLNGIGHSDPSWLRLDGVYRESDPNLEQRPFADGGILDNRPFSHVARSLAERRADRTVGRTLLYVEPQPESPPGAHSGSTLPPDVLQTVNKALMLPRQDPIREDIRGLELRNRTLERVQEVLAETGPTGPSAADVARSSSAEDVPRTVYRRLRARGLVDHLAKLITQVTGTPSSSDVGFAAHYLVRAWKESNFGAAGALPPVPCLCMQDGGRLAGSDRFFEDYDLPFERRRLRFIIERAERLQVESSSGPPGAERERFLSATVAAAADLRSALDRAQRELASEEGPLLEALRQVGLTGAHLLELLNKEGDQGMLREANRLLEARCDGATAVAKAIATGYRDPLTAARDAAQQLFGAVPGCAELSAVAADLRSAYERFDLYDAAVLPIEFGTDLGEAARVGIYRISPADATALRVDEDMSENASELKGVRLANFGAFVDRDWRIHDIVWGRLDAAERLIRSLVPDDRAYADERIREAHEAILWEECEGLGWGGSAQATAAESRSWFLDGHNPKPLPDEPAMRELLLRSFDVVGRLGQGLLAERDALGEKTAATWTALRDLLPPGPGGMRPAIALARALVGLPGWWQILKALLFLAGLLLVLVLLAVGGSSIAGVWFVGGFVGGVTTVLLGAVLFALFFVPRLVGRFRNWVTGRAYGALVRALEPDRTAPQPPPRRHGSP